MKDRKRLTLQSPIKLGAEAATNPNLGWMEFVLTDDKPNANKQGIPRSAFSSLINSGYLMPVKVAEGGIELKHTANARPLGPIVDLTEDDDKIIGRAAIWKEQRPEDYISLKDMFNNGVPVNVSWEIFYTSSTTDDAGVEWIEDPILDAATIVGLPAYAGRTPVLSVASDNSDEYPESEAALADAAKWTTKYMNDLPDSAFLYVEGGEKDSEGKTTPRSKRHFPYRDDGGKVDCPHLRNAIARIPQSNAPGLNKDAMQNKARRLYEKSCKGQASDDDPGAAVAEEALKKIKNLEEQLTALQQYKEQREKADAEVALLQKRTERLGSVGFTAEQIEKDKIRILAMPDDAFEYHVETIARQPATVKVPDVSGAQTNHIDVVKKGLEELRKARTKQSGG